MSTSGEDEWVVPVGPPPSTTMAAGPSAFPTYSAFVDYLAEKYDYRCFRVLQAFFNRLPTINPPRYPPPHMSTLITDLMDGHWRFSSTLNKARLERTEGVRIRAIVLECDDVAYVRRDVLDLVAAHYDLDPVALSMFLEATRIDMEYSSETPVINERPPYLHYSAATFPTQEAKFLAIRFGGVWNNSIASFLVAPLDETNFTTGRYW